MVRIVHRGIGRSYGHPESRSARTLDALMAEGITIPDRPGDEPPRLPRDITDLDDPALMRLFGELTAWAEHLSVMFAAASVDEKEAEEALKTAEAQGSVRHAAEKTVTAAKAKTASDPAVQEAATRYRASYAYRKMLQPIVEGVANRAAFLSRELSRRQARSDVEGRNRRWNP